MKGQCEWRLSGILTASQINKLSLFSPSQFAETLRVCVDNGWRIITPDSEYDAKVLDIAPDGGLVIMSDGENKNHNLGRNSTYTIILVNFDIILRFV